MNETLLDIAPLTTSLTTSERIEFLQRQCSMSFRHAQETVSQHDAYLEERLAGIMKRYHCGRDAALQTLTAHDE
jgi:hypothetical protein